jgi:hypothetical protein
MYMNCMLLVLILYSVGSWSVLGMVNWKGFGRKQSWPKLGCERTEENQEKLKSGQPLSRLRFQLNICKL